MAEKKKRARNFSFEEKNKLIKLVLQHRSAILNKKTDMASNDAKNLAWDVITKTFNANSTEESRTKASLLKAWEKMKADSKVYYNASRCNRQNKASDAKFDQILEQVLAVLGQGGVLDSDQNKTSVDPLDLYEVKMSEERLLEESDPQETSEPHATPPLWSRRRRKRYEDVEGTETESNTSLERSHKKADIGELRLQLLHEEMQHKRELHRLQMESVELDIQIKKKVLEQLDGAPSHFKFSLH